MALTPQQASTRADCYLARARMAFLDHEASTRRYGEDASWSVLALGLKAILGRELTGLLWRAGEPLQRVTYPLAPGEASVQDHVIPLGEIISHIAETPQIAQDLERFRSFMVDHIVMAKIPKTLDDQLTAAGLQSRMPNNDWKQTGLSPEQKQNAVWARYAAIGVVRFKGPGSLFEEYEP